MSKFIYVVYDEDNHNFVVAFSERARADAYITKCNEAYFLRQEWEQAYREWTVKEGYYNQKMRRYPQEVETEFFKKNNPPPPNSGFYSYEVQKVRFNPEEL